MEEIMKIFDNLIKSITLMKEQVERDPLNTELQQEFIEMIQLLFRDQMIDFCKEISEALEKEK